MDALDLFFKKYSYKFPKGYPYMKNEQDILLLESLLNKILNEEIVLEKKLEWKDLSDETRKYYLASLGEEQQAVQTLARILSYGQKAEADTETSTEVSAEEPTIEEPSAEEPSTEEPAA
jgi:hypothetical protein